MQFSRVYKLGFSRFLACRNGTVSVCFDKPDRQRTDRLCLWRRDDCHRGLYIEESCGVFKAWKKYWRKIEMKLMLNHRCNARFSNKENLCTWDSACHACIEYWWPFSCWFLLTQVFYSATLSAISSVSIFLILFHWPHPNSCNFILFLLYFTTTIISVSYISACPPCCSLSLSHHLIHPRHLFSFLLVLVSRCLCALLFTCCQSEADDDSEMRTQVHWADFVALLSASHHHHQMHWATQTSTISAVTSHLGLPAAAAVGTLTITPYTRLTIQFCLNSLHRLLPQSCRRF